MNAPEYVRWLYVYVDGKVALVRTVAPPLPDLSARAQYAQARKDAAESWQPQRWQDWRRRPRRRPHHYTRSPTQTTASTQPTDPHRRKGAACDTLFGSQPPIPPPPPRAIAEREVRRVLGALRAPFSRRTRVRLSPPERAFDMDDLVVPDAVAWLAAAETVERFRPNLLTARDQVMLATYCDAINLDALITLEEAA